MTTVNLSKDPITGTLTRKLNVTMSNVSASVSVDIYNEDGTELINKGERQVVNISNMTSMPPALKDQPELLALQQAAAAGIEKVLGDYKIAVEALTIQK